MESRTTHPLQQAQQGDGRDQAGFTLIEVLIAILVMVFGVMAVANLMLLATASNVAAHQASIAATAASERMEELKAMPIGALPPGTTVTWSGVNPPTGPATPGVPDGSLVQIFTTVTPAGPVGTVHITVTAVPLGAFNARNPVVVPDPLNPPPTRAGATFMTFRN
jgi:prepilin-type N-terminal cleavage/methylation domain-containing protein